MLAFKGRFGASALVVSSVLGAATLGVSLWSGTPALARAADTRVLQGRPALQGLAVDAPRPPTRFQLLPPLHIEYQTTREALDVRLYGPNGEVDEQAVSELNQLLCDARVPRRREVGELNRRTLQLLFKAAYHFESYEVEVVSAYRKPGRRREGPHGTGAAIDFRLRGVPARALASYLRELPRTGVGVYTHPKTQFVHLDSREHSFHWLDASPPRRHWREKSIGARNLSARDDAYSPEQDLPESRE
jgi:uncharacterized protein YcbK (DUF882 family)